MVHTASDVVSHIPREQALVLADWLDRAARIDWFTLVSFMIPTIWIIAGLYAIRDPGRMTAVRKRLTLGLMDTSTQFEIGMGFITLFAGLLVLIVAIGLFIVRH
jgi:hypothetical protein